MSMVARIVKKILFEWKDLILKFYFLRSSIFWKVFVLMIAWIFLAVFPLKVIEFYNKPFPIELVSQRKAIYYVDFCKFGDYDFTLIRFAVNEKTWKRYLLDELKNKWRFNVTNFCEKINHQNAVVPVSFPDHMPPWQYHVQIQILYFINFLHKKSLDIQTKSFILE